MLLITNDVFSIYDSELNKLLYPPTKAVGYLKVTVDQYYLTDYFNTFQYIDTISLQNGVNCIKEPRNIGSKSRAWNQGDIEEGIILCAKAGNVYIHDFAFPSG